MIRPVDFFFPLDLTADISFQSCDEFGKCSVGNKRKQNRMLKKKKSANRVNCEKTSLWPFSFVSVGTSVLAMCFPECMYTHVDNKLQKLNLLFNMVFFTGKWIFDVYSAMDKGCITPRLAPVAHRSLMTSKPEAEKVGRFLAINRFNPSRHVTASSPNWTQINRMEVNFCWPKVHLVKSKAPQSQNIDGGGWGRYIEGHLSLKCFHGDVNVDKLLCLL